MHQQHQYISASAASAHQQYQSISSISTSAATLHQQHQRISILVASVTYRDICPYTSINLGYFTFDVGRPGLQCVTSSFSLQLNSWLNLKPGWSTYATVKGNLEMAPGGSSQGTLWTLRASWFRDHHKGGPRLKPSQELREREFWKTALVKAWLGWEFLRKTLKEGQGLFTPWPWCYWRGGHPKLVPALTPCYHCNPIDSQNFEMRKSLAYFACRRTRSCSILALPLKIWLLW